MPPKLDEEKIDKILELYDDGESAGSIAQKVNVAKGTVQKYVERHRGDDDTSDNTSSNGSGSGSVVEMAGTDGNLVDLTNEELMDMSEGEFIRSFFTEFSDMGVKDSFVEMIANQAQIRQQIPDEDQLSQRLQAHNSGVGNANDANGIAELYWALAQRYLRARGLNPAGGQGGGMMGMGGGVGGSGDWVSAPNGQPQQNNQQNGSSTDDGDWVSTGPSPGIQQGGGQPGQQPGQPQPGQQQNGQMAQFAQMMQQMQQQQQAMMEKVMQQQQQDEKDALEKKIERLEGELTDSGSDSPADSLQEFVELKETLDQINDDGGSDEQMEQIVGTLSQQLQAIQQEIREDDSGAEMGQLMANSDGQFGMLAALAQSGDVDAKEMVQLAQQLGEVETDPGVAEKKYEKEIEEMKVEAEQEKWESIMNGVEQLAGTASEALAAAAGGGGDDSQQAEPEVQTAEPEVEAAQTTEQPSQSPAQELVQQATGGDEPESEPEPEQEEITPDSTQEEVVEPDVVDEETAPEPETEVEPDPEPAKADGGEIVSCPGCGKEFEEEQQVRGHKIHCDQVE